jgi:voltage-gated potassium channel
MIGSDSSRLLRERIFAASMALIAIFFAGSGGLYFLGKSHLGAHAWSFGDCAYMTVTTITTVGFGELPHLHSVPYGRAFTVGVLLAGLGVAAYFVSALTTYFIEGEFTKARTRRKMQKTLDKIANHIIVCGVGTTGVHVVKELVASGYPVVAIDSDERALERIQEMVPGLLPTIHGDATEDAVLERAGVRHARGVVAALTADKDNLYIVVTARELHPGLKIIAKGVDLKAAEKLRKAGAHSVVNPAFIGGVRMVSELIRPQVVEFLDLMLRDRDKNLRIEEVMVPAGSWLVGKPLSEAQIRRHTNLLVLALRGEEQDGDGRFLYNPGSDTQISAGMTLIVLGETDQVHKLRAAVSGGFSA